MGSILFEVVFLTIIVFWTIFAVSSVMIHVRRNYINAYEKHKAEYIQMAIVLIFSTFTMIFLDVLNVLSEDCYKDIESDCSALLKFPST